MDGLRTLEFESSTAPTILWSSDDCGIYLEDTENAACTEELSPHPLQTSNATRYRDFESSTGDFLGVPRLCPDESPFSVASSLSPLTPEGGALLPDLFSHSLGDFRPSDVIIEHSPFFEQRVFVEDTVCPEQLQEDLACQAVWDMSSPSRSVSDPILRLPADDAAPADKQEDQSGSIIPQVQPTISPRRSRLPHIQHQPSSPSTSQHRDIIPPEIRRGFKRRRTDEDDEDYQPHRTYKRAASSQTRPNRGATRKPRRSPCSSKRAINHEEASDERFDCLMLIHGCRKSFTRKNDMERHLGSCKFNPDLHIVTIKCPHCQKTLSRKDALLRHIKQSHDEVE